jgi:flagellar P-ring protein precursor FlgI
MRLIRLIILAIIIFVLVNIISLMKAYADVRIKDIARINQTGETDVMGYGLVIGLNGTGDGKGSQFTVQSVTNMLQRMGVTVPIEKVKIKNVAAVLVTTKIPANAKLGDKLDVTVSSIGDASTLEGGTLVMTPMSDRQGIIYGYSQGSVSIGGFNVQVGDNKIVSNYTLVGRVPNGVAIEREPPQIDISPGVVKLSLYSPDYTTAQRIKESINDRFPGSATTADDAGVALKIPLPLASPDDKVQFISQIENLLVNPDAKARVVINEKTGTIVAGEHVSIAPVALAHGNITIEIKSVPVISQPQPFSQGVTKETTDTHINVTEEQARVIFFEERTNVSEIAAALNAIGATPRDIIAIFQAIKQAGALRAELVVL